MATGGFFCLSTPYSQLIMQLEVPVAWFVLHACMAGDRYVCVATLATLALQADVGIFLARLRLVLRAS